MRPMRAVKHLSCGILVLVLLSTAGCPSVPEPRIAASINNGEAPLTVHFHDISWSRGSAITAWEWHFGDGATSTEQNPTHTYTTPGDHDVRLTVTNATGSAFRLLPDYIHVEPLVLEDGDRVGMLFVSSDCYGPIGTATRAVGSSAFFMPGDIEQLTSLGYMAAPMNSDPCIDLVEPMAPDTATVLNTAQFEAWIAGHYKTPWEPGIWNMAGLDAGAEGTVTASGHSEALVRWEDHPDFPFDPDDDLPPFVSGAYMQEYVFATKTPPLSAAFTWPGGADIGAISSTVVLPEGLTFYFPIAFVPTDPVGDASDMDEIDTSEAMTLLWQAPTRDPGFIQFVLMVDADTDDRGTMLLLVRAVDDGSFTVPADVMAQLPQNGPGVNYDQRLIVSRLLSEDMDVPLAGGGSGQLRTVALTGAYIRDYSSDKSSFHKSPTGRPLRRMFEEP